MKQKLKPKFVPSRLFIYYNERVMEGTVETDSGAQIRDGIKSVAQQGDCPEKRVAVRHRQVRGEAVREVLQHALKYKAVDLSETGADSDHS